LNAHSFSTMKILITILRGVLLSRQKYTPCLSLFFLCFGLCAAQDSVVQRDLVGGNPTSIVLTYGVELRLRIKFGDSQAQEIFVQTSAPDVAFRLVSEDGDVVKFGHILTTGWAAVSIASPKDKQIQLSLTLDHAIEGLPGAHLWIERFGIPLSTLGAHDQASRLLSAAQALHNSLRAEDLRLATIKYQQAAGEWGYLNDPYGASIALGGKSETQYELSQFSDALRSLMKATGQNARSIYLRAWLEHLEARVYLGEWDGTPARDHAQESLRLAREINEPASSAPALGDLAEAIVYTGDSQDQNYADEALSQGLSNGLPEAVAVAKRVQAWIDEEHEGMADALALLNEVQIWFHRAGDVRNEMQTTEELAVPLNFTGDTYQALARSFKFEPISKASGDAIDWGVLVDNLGLLYAELGRPRVAAIYYKKARSAYSGAHFRFGLSLIYGELCEVESSFQQVRQAFSDCTMSLALAQQLRNPAIIGMAQMRLGVAEEATGNRREALKHLDLGIRSSESVHDSQWEVKEHLKRGELLEADRDSKAAISEYLKAQSISKDVADPSFLLEAQYHVAEWHVRGGQYEQASDALKPALDRVEAKRQSVSSSTLQAGYFAAERKCYELAIELRMREFGRDPAGGADALALEMSERSRGRGLLDALTARYTANERERNDDQVGLMHSNMAVDRAFNRRLKTLVEGGTKRDLDSSAAQLTQALSDLERAEDKVHADASDATKGSSTMSTAEIERAGLNSGTTFFEYALGVERSYLWVIDRDTIKSYVLPSRERLEGMVKRWRNFASRPELSDATAHAKFQLHSALLSCALLGSAVEAHMTRIVIVPDGNLVTLPFAALPENGCSNTPGDPLIVNHELSLSIFLARKSAERREFQGELAIVADPVFDRADPRAAMFKTGELTRGLRYQDNPVALPRLLNAGYEASAIQEVVRKSAGKDKVFLAQGFDASVETVLSPAMQNYRIWHLATHGFYDEAVPEFSGLIFSTVGPDGSSRFSFLKAHDISSLKVRADLVVLSACDSATGQNLSGEGMMGLSYSFLRAGAKQVVSTLWNVDDSKSRELMILFYTELMQNGGNAAAALRQSQLEILRQRHSSAPYYWAGFELTSMGN
jgi:CHAT domain-containing protein